jgi:hypothetical protein
MQTITEELRAILHEYSQKINDISIHSFYDKPNPAKWSKMEVLGHLVDSAQNNLRRFICGQYEASPPHIVYQQDFWVAANNYRQAEKNDIVQLWVLLNHRIADILNNMPASSYEKMCNTGKDTPQLRTLEWLASDYVKHMKHHLNQILPGSFAVEYP